MEKREEKYKEYKDGDGVIVDPSNKMPKERPQNIYYGEDGEEIIEFPHKDNAKEREDDER